VTIVYLSPTEINYAYAVAELRHENAKSNQHQDRFKGEFKNTLPDKIGALGEFALAKHLNLYWGYEPYNPKANDVGRYEVRTTPRPDGCLLTRDLDKPAIYVLATLDKENKAVVLRGWNTLYETMQVDRWAPYMPLPCFKTPQTLLHAMSTLPAAI
jgi:hypothetical protein